MEQTRVEQLRGFGEACEASVTEAREAAESAQSELTTDRQRFAEGLEQTLASATLLRSAEERSERRRLKEVSATRPAPIAPVIDIRFCIDNLASLRIEAVDHSLTDFSDYWAPDFPKTNPNKPNTFVPNHLLKPSNPLWEPFFDPGLSRQDTDGSSQVDPNHPPHFRVLQEVLGRALHTFKRKYVDDDFRRTTDEDLSEHINAVASNVKEGVTNAARLLKDRKDDILKKHEETMTASQAHIAEANGVYRETVDNHVVALQQQLQGTSSLAQGLKEQADNLKRMVLSTHVVPSLKLDDKDLGFVKQLKELQVEHYAHLILHEQLEASKKRDVDQLNAAREVNREASQVIADLEERIKYLDQDKLGLEQNKVKLEKEVETLKRKRRSTPSPTPANRSAPTPTLRILQRGEKESPAAKETTLSPSSLPPPKKSRNRSKRWNQPAIDQETKAPLPARTPNNVNGKKVQEQGIKDDPVLYASLNSFRNKRDIDEEIRMSSKTLGHGSKGSEEVFHRQTITH